MGRRQLGSNGSQLSIRRAALTWSLSCVLAVLKKDGRKWRSPLQATARSIPMAMIQPTAYRREQAGSHLFWAGSETPAPTLAAPIPQPRAPPTRATGPTAKPLAQQAVNPGLQAKTQCHGLTKHALSGQAYHATPKACTNLPSHRRWVPGTQVASYPMPTLKSWPARGFPQAC